MIVDKMSEGVTMQVKCTSQPEGNNCSVAWSLKNVLRLCLPLEIAFLVEKMNYCQQTRMLSRFGY